MPQRCACIKPTISTEKPENVVKLPRNPVIQSKRHCGSVNSSANTPISSAPSQFAANVPIEKGAEDTSTKPNSQRNTAPTAAPQTMGKI
jgi:hypothetical protein